MSPRFRTLVLALMVFCLMAAASAAPSLQLLSTTPDWTVVEVREGAGLGGHVSTAGDVNGDGFDDVLVCAPVWDDFVDPSEGKVFLYLGSASGLSLTPAWTFEGNKPDAQLGFATSAGDVNGDGFGDVIVAAPEYNPERISGRVWLFLGSSTGLSATPAWTREGGLDTYVATSVAAVGDVNGDGFDDMMVGAPGQDFNRFDEGGAFLFLGSASGPSTIPDQVLKGSQELSAFGVAVAGAGDVDGDGFDDVLIGSPGYDGAQEDQGRVYVFRGSPRGLRPHPVAALEIGGEILFGNGLGRAGDINADGFDDFLVSGGHLAGVQRVYVYMGSKAARNSQPELVLQPDQPQFLSFGTAGDVNGDGFGDVIVSAPRQDDGRVFVYRGTAAGLDPVPLQTLAATQAGEYFGGSVSAARDVNGDGFDDVIIGAPVYNPGGRALVFHGGP